MVISTCSAVGTEGVMLMRCGVQIAFKDEPACPPLEVGLGDGGSGELCFL